MIRSLRRKFILVAMLSLLGTLSVLCGAITLGNHLTTASRADRAIALLYQNGGQFLDPDNAANPSMPDFQVTWETPFETRYFIVELTARQEVKSVDLEHIAALDRQSVVESISQILRSGDDRGYTRHYRFGVFQNEDGGSTVIALDCFLLLQSSYNMLRITVFMSLGCVVMVFLLLVFFSKKAIRPFAENLERQRQFVTDASHELKTPLTILSANLGLLEDSYGKDKWLESAQAQIARLDRLIKNLVELARTEEAVKDASVTAFSLSEVALSCADAFAPLAEAAGKALTAEIAPGVDIRGVPDDLFRLLSILLDNAVKYCDPGGTIHLALSQRRRAVWVELSNPCAGLDPAQLPRYFDRFYRADSSRARATGGYGIGLSTARAIAARHRGRISNRYAGGVITFSVQLPQSGKPEQEKKQAVS